MVHQIPNIFINSSFSQFNKIPKSWNDTLLQTTIADITKNIDAFFNPFNASPFSNSYNEDDNYHKTFLLTIQKELFGLYDFLELFPILSHINNQNQQFYYFIDLNTTTLLFQYCWFLVIDTFFSITENRPVIAFISTKNASNNELEELDLINTNTNTIYPAFFKKDVANLISLFIDNYKNINDITNMSYSTIRDKVDIMHRKEKKNLATNFLGKLNREELRIENELKQNKLGNWSDNVHFFRYNKAYETEASKLLDRYIDYDDEIYQTDTLANTYNNDNDNDNVDESQYAYGIDGDGYNDDQYDDDEYDNYDYANNDDFEL
jgi:hypothetical protein